jgi:hypothetical protein
MRRVSGSNPFLFPSGRAPHSEHDGGEAVRTVLLKLWFLVGMAVSVRRV